MEILPRIILGSSYMVGLVLAIAWTIGALSNIDSGVSGLIVLSLAGVVACGVAVGLASLRISTSRRSRVERPGRRLRADKPWRN